MGVGVWRYLEALLGPGSVVLLLLVHVGRSDSSNAPWATWWDYEGVAGPQHWGIINPDWRMCRTGKFQSPIDIRPHNLLFDPNLRRMNVNLPDVLGGTLVNTGNDLTLRLSANWSVTANFSDGPLMYTYRVAQLKLHFGKTDTEGSEHSVDGNSFAAELQFVAYNTELYKNLTDAMQAPYGVAIIAVFAEVLQFVAYNTELYKNLTDAMQAPYGVAIIAVFAEVASEEENTGFRSLVEHAKQVPWQGQTPLVTAYTDLCPNRADSTCDSLHRLVPQQGQTPLVTAYTDLCPNRANSTWQTPLVTAYTDLCPNRGKLHFVTAYTDLCPNRAHSTWQTKEVKDLGVKSLLPDTNYYLTYEGSLTQPACHETVTWVLFNKPIYVSRIQLDTLRQFQKRLYGEESVTQLAGNRRPVMPLNNRAVRTNINYPTSESDLQVIITTFAEAAQFFGLTTSLSKTGVLHQQAPGSRASVHIESIAALQIPSQRHL
ncbi:carbonic anhydrase-related protein 10-like [Babylonia areolata]|uniref:carbonic anhydrase-related protein 10-like n=1 Tax=Babylonia areolata TaxID=304850 RepID=UPI003FD4D972